MVENDLDDIYNIIWRVVNNIDAKRDVYLEDIILIDASTKNELDNFVREWPKDVLCSQEVLTKLKEKGLLENV
jgi:4-hydroxy-3-polyprenylbenzoate decarboxylase